MIKKNVAVVFGGISVEHDISIITGVQIANALNKDKFNVYPVFIDKQGKWFYSEKFFNIKYFQSEINEKKAKLVNFSTFDKSLYILKGKKQKPFAKIDFVFLGTHGSYGENGALQGYFDMCCLPYSSPGVLGSAVCMNKIVAKNILTLQNINTTKYAVLNQEEFKKGEKYFFEKLKNLKFPLIVKPCSLGSSIGINFCKTKNSLKNAINFAFLFDTEVLVEEVVSNLQEVNLAVVGNSLDCELSDIEEVVLKKDFLTFENKYLNKESSSKGMENTLRIIPAQLDSEIEKQVVEFGKKAFFALNCSGIVRIDFLVDKETKKVYLNEVNTIPGSLSNYLWKTKKYNFMDLLEKLMEYCIQEFESKNKKIKNFSSNVLSQFEECEKLDFKK